MKAAAGVLLASLVVAGAAGAAAPWQTIADKSMGFSVGVPGSWQVVPRSSPQLDAVVVRLRREKRLSLANQFAQVAAVRRTTHTTFSFQAFAWPPPKGAVVPDVTLKTDRLSSGTTGASLPYLARQIAKAIAGTSGATASTPSARKLPAGQAMTITGTTRLSKRLRSRFALYLLVHRRRLYSLSFRGPETPFENRIASSFRFLAP